MKLKPPENIPIYELEIPFHIYNILNDAGIKNVKQLCEMKEEEFWNIHYMNKEKHKIIETAVEKKLKSLMAQIPRKKPTALHVAQYFISKSNPEGPDYITQFKLHPLLYYAQGFHLSIYGDTLFDEKIIAGPYGPFIPSIHDRFKRYAYKRLNPNQNYLIDEETGELFNHYTLREYYKGYKGKPKLDLSCPFIKRLFNWVKG